MDDRYLAFKILCKIEHEKAYSNIILDNLLSQNNVSYAPFVCALVYGVVERKITLDYILSTYLTKPLKKLNPQVLTILRLGTYQIKFMDKVPSSAAVNESVKLCKKIKCSFASGLVNSILRKISQSDISYPHQDDIISFLSVKYSCPVDLVKHYINDYGQMDTENFLKDSLNPPSIFIRVNTLKTDDENLIKLLLSDGIVANKTNLANCLEIVKCGNIIDSKYYKNGYFHIQDKASQICINTLNPKPNDIVFDMCASPGGKSFTISEYMKNQGQLFSFDLYEQRVNLIKNGAKRLGIDIINCSVGDSSIENANLPKADKILCDVPCSGLGVIRRKPEIKYKDLEFVDKLTDLQYNILNCASKYLKDFGEIVYSTCSLNKEENQYICDKFLKENSSFKKVNLCDDDGYLTLMPHKDGTDGFFIAKFIKE